MTLAVYGIIRADHPLPAGLRAVVADDLAVAVADIGTTELGPADARSHLDVLCGLLPGGPVLPLRFGSTASDDDSVRDNALRADPEALRLELDRVTGMVEVRVQLTFDENAVLTALLAEEPALARAVSGLDATIEHGRRISDRVRTLMSQRSAEFVSGITPDVVRLTESGDLTEQWALLVRATELDRVADAIAALPAIMTATALGPLPPYSFVSLPTRPVSRWGFD